MHGGARSPLRPAREHVRDEPIGFDVGERIDICHDVCRLRGRERSVQRHTVLETAHRHDDQFAILTCWKESVDGVEPVRLPGFFHQRNVLLDVVTGIESRARGSAIGDDEIHEEPPGRTDAAMNVGTGKYGQIQTITAVRVRGRSPDARRPASTCARRPPVQARCPARRPRRGTPRSTAVRR